VIERLVQTYRHLLASPDEQLAVELSPEQRALLAGFSRPDRRHALSTYAKLRDAGADEELCAVGLLHDLGKPRQTRLWHRIAAVLAPGIARRIGGTTMRDYLDHATIGAAKARAMGLSERAVQLIARHHDPPEDPEASALVRADREHA
jgi:putative nucleotidyltransferase with HDIG domain